MVTKEGLGCYGILKEINKNLDLVTEEFTSKDAAEITQLSQRAIRNSLNRLVKLGILTMHKEKDPKNKNRPLRRYRINVFKLINIFL